MSGMIGHQLALIKREVWEHRSIWITPAAVAFVVTFIAIAAVFMVAAFGEAINPEIERIADATLPDAMRRAALAVFLLGNTTVFMFAMWFLLIFYCLDALYAERKDRSILFWRSLPITDAETVVSKLLTAFVAIPVAMMAGVIVSHLLNLIIMSFWLSTEGVNPIRFIWSAVPLFDTWAAVLIFLLAIPVWMAPLLGWLIFISAWAKQGPFLRAVMPIAILPFLEYIIFKSWHLGIAIVTRLGVEQMPIFDIFEFVERFDEDNLHNMLAENVSLLSMLDVGRFLTSVEVWAGLVVCGLFMTAAIYVRRYRDES
jgi:ABC-2 type transport system permease protein